MTRIVRFHKTGGPEVLQIDELEILDPGPDEIQIDIHALGLNRAEAMFRAGEYVQESVLPGRPGYEAAGRVIKFGKNVSGFNEGDAVSVIPSFNLNDYGVYGEKANVPASAVTKHPEELDWNKAAALWMQYITAYGALIDIANIKTDDIVLIPAASSSVGLAAIQICKMIGAVPIALTRSSDKREALLKHGAEHVVVTEEDDLAAEVNKITEGRGANVVFDPVGGEFFSKLTSVMSYRGIIFVYGALSPQTTELSVMDVLGKNLTVRGYQLFEITDDAERLGKAKKFIIDGIKKGLLDPVIDKVFTLEQMVEAHRYMESNQQFGKIVVSI